jgi:hypothetical protein
MLNIFLIFRTYKLIYNFTGKQIPIRSPPFFDLFFPTVNLKDVSVEANFGDDQQAKPFKYDIDKCPGLVLD